MHFDQDHHQGQPAIDKHLEFFKATGMDFLKIQYEQELPDSIPITKPEDWVNVPPCTADFFEPTLHVVKELVKAAKAEAPVIMTLYSPFMWFKYLAEAEVVSAHFRENPEAMKKGLEIFTDYVLTLARLCKQAGVDGFYASTQGGESFRFKGTNIFQDYIKPADLAVWEAIKDSPVNILHVCDYHGGYDDLTPFLDYPGPIVSCGLNVGRTNSDSQTSLGTVQASIHGRVWNAKGVIATGDLEAIRRGCHRPADRRTRTLYSRSRLHRSQRGTVGTFENSHRHGAPGSNMIHSSLTGYRDPPGLNCRDQK